MQRVLRAIDSANEWMGKAMRWLMLAMILDGVIEVVQRYVFNHPTMWGYETIIMIGAAMYALSWGYVHLKHGHVRVDVFYGRFSPRGKAIIDVVCALLFLLPLVGMVVWTSGSWMWRAWIINEKSYETYWLPPIAPLRTAVFIGVCLFALQGIAQFVRDLHLLVRGKHYD